MQAKHVFSWKRLLLAAVFIGLGAWPRSVQAQAPAAVLLVDVDNYVTYNYDTYDYTKFGVDPTVTTAVPMRAFAFHIGIGDIVAVNGKPVKGTILWRSAPMFPLTPTPQPGQAIADTTRAMMDDLNFEFVGFDGTMIGTITASGLSGGAPPAGAPLAMTRGNFAITGGTGAFLGVRGQTGLGPPIPVPGARGTASVTEDPANRRNAVASKGRFVLHLLPMFSPEVVQTAAGPAVVHSNDFTPVSADKPAKSGEVLTLFATGLGPTRPGLDPGQPFPATPLQVVNAPVAVIVNGAPAEVLDASGYPGTTNAYQVNFRLPAGVTTGLVTLQVTSAWIAGSAVKIAVQ